MNRLPAVKPAPTPAWMLPAPAPKPATPKTEAIDRREHQRRMILAWLKSAPGHRLPANALRVRVRGTRQEIEDALRVLASEGKILAQRRSGGATISLAEIS